MSASLELSVGDREALERLARSRVGAHRRVATAGALLVLADGASVRATARSLGVHQDTVRNWRDRFAQTGVAGVGVVAPGRGRKRQVTAEQEEAIVYDTLHTVPEDGSARWSTRTMAARHGVGKNTVWRIWGERGLRPWRTDTFKLSTDPDFEAKLTDVVGLYVDPPERAVVFSFDEKTQCQQPASRDKASQLISEGSASTASHRFDVSQQGQDIRPTSRQCGPHQRRHKHL